MSRAACCLLLVLASWSLAAQPRERVVSLAPAITETIYALGCGDQLVGDTRFCDYPPAAAKVAKVGGFLDLNLEALVALQPTVIFCNPEHHDHLSRLAGRVAIVAIPHDRLADVYTTITQVAARLHVARRGADLVRAIQADLAAVARYATGVEPVPVLCVIGRNPESLESLIAAGNSTFLADLLAIAGGRNAYSGSLAYPSLGLEAVLDLKPGCIIEMSAFYEGIAEADVLAQWRRYRQIPAVAAGRIVFVRDSFWLRPGPRVAQIAQQLRAILPHAGH
jgi:iron complex transport system substrate-binding protein